MLNDSFAHRLQEIMRLRNVKASELSAKTNIAKSQISHWLNGTYKAKQDSLTILAEFFDVNEAWLMGFDVSMDRVPSPVEDNVSYQEIKTTKVKIPVLGSVPAGIPIEAIEDILGYIDLDYSLVKHGERYFGLKVHGDSMFPDYKDGDILVVKQQADCDSGDDCVVLVNGYDATFKRVIKQENGILLKPLNTKYEPYYFSADDVSSVPVVILGIATEVRRKVK